MEPPKQKLYFALYTNFDNPEYATHKIGEEIISNYLQHPNHTEETLAYLKEFCLNSEATWFVTNVMKSITMLDPPPGTHTWRHDLIRDMLASPSIEIRIAAIDAIEDWDGEHKELLKHHTEKEDWINEQIQDTLNDC